MFPFRKQYPDLIMLSNSFCLGKSFTISSSKHLDFTCSQQFSVWANFVTDFNVFCTEGLSNSERNCQQITFPEFILITVYLPKTSHKLQLDIQLERRAKFGVHKLFCTYVHSPGMADLGIKACNDAFLIT